MFNLKGISKYKIDYLFPKKNKIVILDNPGSNLIKKALRVKHLPIISTRKNSKINLLIVFLSFFQSYKYSKGQRYIIAYIKYLKPKVIISHIDNNIFFFSLKKIFKNIKFAFIQNGLGILHFNKSERKKMNLYADLFFSYSKAFTKLYSKILKSKIYTIGSFKNNFLRIKKKTKKIKFVVFISQFRLNENSNKKRFVYSYSGKNISFDQFYKAESLLLPILYEFCKKKNYKLVIAGSNLNRQTSLKEKIFFEDIIKKNTLIYEKKYFLYKKIKSEYSSYYLTDKASLVVFIDSALGYQSLARGNKTLSCSLRSKYVGNKNLKFGWPSLQKKEGPFWINYFDKKKILNKLEVLINLSPKQWRQIYKKKESNLVAFDYGNQIFKDVLKKALN